MASVLIVDATSIFSFQQYLKSQAYEVKGNPDYAALLESLVNKLSHEQPSGARQGVGSSIQRAAGTRHDLAESFDLMFAFVAINPEHEGQQKFCTFLRSQGFTVDQTDFRDAFIVPNREHAFQRLTSQLSYLIGMLSSPYNAHGKKRILPRIVAVTDAYDIYFPLLDYTQVRGGKATIAFFRRGMEDRWERAGLFDANCPVEFLDLSPDAPYIIGTDLGVTKHNMEGGEGLAGFAL